MAEIKRRILVTGATGLIGSSVVEQLLAEGRSEVFAAGRNVAHARERFASSWGNSLFHFIKYDVREPLEGDIDFDYIIHCAGGACPGAFASDPVGVMMANIEGVKLLMDYGRTHSMRRFVYISSGEVYGERHDKSAAPVWRECESGFVDPMSPRSCYPSAKRAAETLCASYAAQYGIDVVVARPCHTYGPHFSPRDNRAFAQFIAKAARGEDIVLKSCGEQYRSWLYVEDCARAIITIMERGVSGEAYNVADETQCVTIHDFAQTIADEGGVRLTFDLPSDDEKRGFSVITRAVFDTTKLRSLGWTPTHTLAEGLHATMAALKKTR